MFHFNDISEVA